ncbi:hypothetical protein BGW80DRAFT_400705 [Lactifluus volemus]|nr:hypothetical protein BGW80DRAFT_400705 [Lactifluus volemus]
MAESTSKETSHKSTTAARMAVSSGPAAATAEVRKSKRLRTKPQADNATDPFAMDVISPQINPAVTSITIPAEAVHTANTRALPYPPSEMSPTPPPIPMPPFQIETSPTPPASPTPRRPPQSTTQAHGADNTNDSLMESAPPTPTEEVPFPQARNPAGCNGTTSTTSHPVPL